MIINTIKFLSNNVEKKLGFYFGLTIIFIMAASICTASIPLAFKKIIDSLSHGNTDIIFVLIILYLSLLLFENFFNEIQFLSYPIWENGLTRNVYIAIFESLFNSKADFFRDKLHGAIANQIYQAISGLDCMMFDLVFKTLPFIINFAFIIFTIIVSLNTQIAIIIVAGSMGYMLVMYISNRELLKHQINLRNSVIDMQGVTTDLIFSWRDIKLNNPQQYVKNVINKNVINMNNKTMRFYFVRSISGFIQTLVICIVIGGANYYEIMQYLDGRTTLGSVVLVNNYLFIIMRPLTSFSLIARGLVKSYSDFKTIFTILDSEKESFKDQNKLLSIKSIHLENIKAEKIINNLNLNIRRGEKIVIIGESGSGKTTLFDIMTGLNSNFTGAMYINGDKNNNFIVPSFLKHHVGYCCSNARLINDNLSNNIQLGKDIDINPYLKFVFLNNKIQQLKDGVDTIISENCSFLSDGEAQRIKIARIAALERDFEFYDESTSHLDEDLTKKIIVNLLSRKDKTILFITHNSRFLHLFDTVYSLTNGSLTEIKWES
jgi:ABC-type bacteriocin/lantibiotic exporter with double-glycine peptidase domain